MKEISGFFDKFKSIALKELYRREAICDAIEKVTKQKIDVKDIEIKNGIMFIKGNQGFKSEVFLKKRAILDLISKNNITIIDIK